jgi:hypothetical protein
MSPSDRANARAHARAITRATCSLVPLACQQSFHSRRLLNRGSSNRLRLPLALVRGRGDWPHSHEAEAESDALVWEPTGTQEGGCAMPVDPRRESWKPGMSFESAVEEIAYIRGLAERSSSWRPSVRFSARRSPGRSSTPPNRTSGRSRCTRERSRLRSRCLLWRCGFPNREPLATRVPRGREAPGTPSDGGSSDSSRRR